MQRPYTRAIVVAGWIALLVLPALAWALIDQSVWPWDPSYYGDSSMRLGFAAHDLREWLENALYILKMMPPLIVWMGQFFVPLRHITGDIESALLLFNVLVAAGTLALVYKVARDLAADHLANPTQSLTVGLAAMTACGGASLFIGLSHQFLTEILQCFAAALSVTLVLHAERRSWLRNAAGLMLMLGVAFLAKASSIAFVLPAMVYMTVVLLITRKDARPATRRADLAWTAISAAVLLLAVTWYVANWDWMMVHFVQATVGTEIQGYRAREPMLTQLHFWVVTLADSFSPMRLFSGTCGALIAVGLILTALQAWRTRASLHHIVRSGTLYGFYLAGMAICIVLSYAMQINQDPRYIAPLVPILACLLGWALVRLRRFALAALILVAFTANAVFLNAAALGVTTPLNYRWLWTADADKTDKNILMKIVRTTCEVAKGRRPVALGVSYPFINPNSANFYAAIYHLESGADCLFIPIPQDDAAKAMAMLDDSHLNFAVTVAPEYQDSVNFANVTAKAFAEAVALDQRFELLPESPARVRIYRRIAVPQP
jgi:hypothetical protein